MSDPGHIAQEDLASYAMQLLPPEESATIRAHLAECALCRETLAELSGDLALLALEVEPQPLPAGARERFLNRLSTDQLSKRQATEVLSRDQVTQPTRSSGRRSLSWVPWALAAALGIAAISFGVESHTLDEQLQDESALVTNLAAKASRAQQVLEVLTSPTTQRATLTLAKTPSAPGGRVSYLPDRGGLVFVGSDLKPLAAGKTYELWVIPANGKAPIPAGLFRPDQNGSANLVLPPLPTGVPAKAFGVTVENEGGSDVPTAPILLSGTTGS